MVSWLAPFITLAVVLALYFASNGTPRQAAMRRDINFYLVCVLAVSIVSVIAGARYGRDWLDIGAWVVAAVAAGAALVHWRSGGGKGEV